MGDVPSSDIGIRFGFGPTKRNEYWIKSTRTLFGPISNLFIGGPCWHYHRAITWKKETAKGKKKKMQRLLRRILIGQRRSEKVFLLHDFMIP